MNNNNNNNQMQITTQVSQYETLSTSILPTDFHYIIGYIGKDRTKSFYQAQRGVWKVSAFKFPENLKKLSLIIGSILPNKPPYKPLIDKKTNETKLDNVSGLPKTVVDFDQITQYIRYFGIVDLDMPAESVKNAKMKLYESDPNPAHVYPNIDAIKLAWSEYLKRNCDKTIAEIRADSVPFNQVCTDAEQLGKCLKKAGLYTLCFFSGCKGFRLLWYDPKLFYWVFNNEDYPKAFMNKVATRYYIDLGCDPMFIARLDPSIYDRKKGVKPDVTVHPDSGLAPFHIKDIDQFNTYKFCSTTVNQELSEKIANFWYELPNHIPKQVPHLRAFINNDVVVKLAPKTQATIQLNTHYDQDDDDDDETVKPIHTNAIKRKQPDDSLATQELSLQSTVSQEGGGGGDFINKLSGEMKTGINMWMAKFDREQKVFPPYNLKPGPGTLTTLIISGWRYCNIKHAEHTDKDGKIYFLIKDYGTRIVQKCHSAGCNKQEDHVWMSDHIIKKRKDDSIKRVNEASEKRRNEKLERERQIRLAEERIRNRPPSPDSSLPVNTIFLPRHTTTNEQEEEDTKDTTTTIATSKIYTHDPILKHNLSIPSYRYRYFKDRLAAKSYYINEFKHENKELYTWPLVINLLSTSEFQLESNYITVDRTRIDTMILKECVYIVLYSETTKLAVEWGFITKKKIASRVYCKDNTKYIIRNKHVDVAIPFKRALLLQIASSFLPLPVHLDDAHKGEYEPELDWQSKGYTYVEDIRFNDKSLLYFDNTRAAHVKDATDRFYSNCILNIAYLCEKYLSEFIPRYNTLVQTIGVCSIAKEIKHSTTQSIIMQQD